MLRSRCDTEVGLEKLMKYESALKEAEKRNTELIREIKALQRIQNEQGKALEKITTENDYVNKIKNLMEELRIAREKNKELESKQKKDEKTVKTQFDHMMKLQERCRELKASALGGGDSKAALAGDSDKALEEHKEKLLTAEQNKEILVKAAETEKRAHKLTKAKYEAQLKEINAKVEKLEQQLREKEQESKIASSKLRELQASGTGLPAKRKTLEPINRQPSVGGVRNSHAGGKTQPSSPVAAKKEASKSALAQGSKDPSLTRKPA